MIHNPHDALFKSTLGRAEHARGMLRAIVPTRMGEALDWSTLALQPSNFVGGDLSQQYTDLLYSAAWLGGEAPVYFLFEHQSTLPTEDLMAHRLLRYQVRIWDRWRVEHRGSKALPVIIPVVLYHGVAPWSEPGAFDALLEVPVGVRREIEPYLVRFAYLLHDLSQIDDEELRGCPRRTALGKLVSVCFKHARTRVDFLEIVGGWMDVAREVAGGPNGLETLAQVMRYILEVNEYVEPEALQALLERELGPEAKEAIVTAGQRLIEQGRLQGLEQGRQQGLLQGVQQLLLRMLRQRFGVEVDASVERRVAAASVEEIEGWSVRVASAFTLADVLGG
jgi:predicted transposase YdaD